MFKDKGHAVIVILLASLAAGATSAAVQFPQYAALLGTLAAMLLAASGGTAQQARKAEPPEPKPPGPGPVLLVLLVAALALPGCSRFMHFSDPSLEDLAATFCDEYKSAHMGELETQAKTAGLPLDDILHAFDVACLLRVKSAGPAGMFKAGVAR